MGDIAEELSQRFCRRVYPCRHCPTCICDQREEYSRKIASSMSQISLENWPVLDRVRDYRRRPCQCQIYNTSRCFSPICWRSPGISNYMDKLYYWDQKYAMLENWFKRFDFDNDGHLSLNELKCLLDHVGGSVGEYRVQQILDRADRDCDGRLSFSEFLLMWRQAAADEILDDEDFSELRAIIRRHQLYPDVITRSHPLYGHYNHLDPMTIKEEIRIRHPFDDSRYYRSNTPSLTEERFQSVKRTHRTNDVGDVTTYTEEKNTTSSPPETPDPKKRIIFSCNRYSIY